MRPLRRTTTKITGVVRCRRSILQTPTGLSDVRHPEIPGSQGSEITRIFLLENVAALDPTGDSLLPKAAKTRAAFAYLCLLKGREVARLDLADMFWGQSRYEQGLDVV